MREKGQRKYRGYIPVKTLSGSIEHAMNDCKSECQQRLELEGQEQTTINASDEPLCMHQDLIIIDWGAN